MNDIEQMSAEEIVAEMVELDKIEWALDDGNAQRFNALVAGLNQLVGIKSGLEMFVEALKREQGLE